MTAEFVLWSPWINAHTCTYIPYTSASHKQVCLCAGMSSTAVPLSTRVVKPYLDKAQEGWQSFPWKLESEGSVYTKISNFSLLLDICSPRCSLTDTC